MTLTAIHKELKTVQKELAEIKSLASEVMNAKAAEAGKWTGYEGCPEFAEKVFDANKGDKKISMADSK